MIKKLRLLLAIVLLITPFFRSEAQHEIRIQGVVRDLSTSEPIGCR